MEKKNTSKLEAVYQKIRAKAKSDPSFLERLKKGDISALKDINCDKEEKYILDTLKNEISAKFSNGKIDDIELEKASGGFLDLGGFIDDFLKICKDISKSNNTCH